MPSLKHIRLRITSVSSTKQITSAMKMVSASKLRRAQNSIILLRPYANKLHEILSHISSVLDTTHENIYAQQRDDKRVLLVLITSNRGLCGAFNANVVKKAIELANSEYQKQYATGNLDFMVIGKKAQDILKAKGYTISSTHHELFDQLTFEQVDHLAQSIMDSFKNHGYDKVILLYNQFKNAAVQNLTAEQFLPVQIEESNNHSIKYDYIFEPSKEYIIEKLIPKSLKIQFYKAILDSVASEHGARMTAMHKATDNATDMIRQIKLNYNKARQATITKEIIEIVGGAEALNN